MQDLGARFIGKRHVRKGNVLVHGSYLRPRRVFLYRRVQNLCQPVDGHARLAHLRDHAPEPPNRRNEHRVIKGKRNKLALCHIAVYAQNASEHHDQHHLQAARYIADRPELRERIAELHPKVRILLILRLKAFSLKLLPAKRAHHTHTREILLRDGRQNALGLVAVCKSLADLIVEQQRI